MTMNKTIRLAQCIGTCGMLLLMSSGLSGCATMLRHFGYEPIRKTMATRSLPACRNADVLITNLIVPRRQRQYQRPDGRPCYEVSHYES